MVLVPWKVNTWEVRNFTNRENILYRRARNFPMKKLLEGFRKITYLSHSTQHWEKLGKEMLFSMNCFPTYFFNVLTIFSYSRANDTSPLTLQ